MSLKIQNSQKLQKKERLLKVLEMKTRRVPKLQKGDYFWGTFSATVSGQNFMCFNNFTNVAEKGTVFGSNNTGRYCYF